MPSVAKYDGVLDVLGAMAPGECFATPEVIEVFRAYVTSWRASAVGPELLWERDIPAEQVEYDMHAFQRVAEVLALRYDWRDTSLITLHNFGSAEVGDVIRDIQQEFEIPITTGTSVSGDLGSAREEPLSALESMSTRIAGLEDSVVSLVELLKQILALGRAD